MLELLTLGLATWRISSLLVEEDGPFDFFAKMRRKIGITYNEYSQKVGSNVLAEMLTCMWCTSFWVAIAICLLFDASLSFTRSLAVGAIAIIIDRIIYYGNK